MLDLSPFTDDKFDGKRWINAACKSRHLQDGVEKHLSDLEMKLQVASEEIATSLEEQSSAALLRLPRASRDIVRLRDDAVSLRSAVSSILLKLKKAEGSSAESIAALAKVDTIKQRIEAAYKTLQDAAGLTQLSSMVEDVFSSGDLPRAADTLANMRQCLSAVGEVAEFASVRKQLEVLEDRLDSMVQPHLTDALTNRRVNVSQDLWEILIRIGRFKSLELQYTKVHLKTIRKLWEDFELQQRASKTGNERNELERLSGNSETQSTTRIVPLSSWLPSFCDGLLLYLEQEWKWCMLAFPDDYKSLIPKLLMETVAAIGAIALSLESTLPLEMLYPILKHCQKGIKVQMMHLEALIELHNITGTFAKNVQHLFSEANFRVLMDTLKSVYLPYESFKQKYGKIERLLLSGEISAVDLRGAVSCAIGAQGIELSETVRRIEESIPQVILLLDEAVERCISLTGGSEADELILALDDLMLQYISALQETLKSLRAVCGVDFTGEGNFRKDVGSDRKEVTQTARKLDSMSNEEEWSIVQGALQILTVADCLTSRSSVFEASLRVTLARLGTSLSVAVFGSSLDQNRSHLLNDGGGGEVALGGRAAFDVAAIRLIDAPEKARKLFNLLDQLKDPRFHALPHASQRVAEFADTVNELVYDVLISKVRQRLNEMSWMPIWSSVEEPSAFSLPTFSAYPQPYVTSVGEYLLTLPQQLEPLAEGIAGPGDAGNEEAQFFATEWMLKVIDAIIIADFCLAFEALRALIALERPHATFYHILERQVAEGASALFMEQVRGIQYITERGAQQLSVDIKYLSNVLSALSMPIPPVLATFHACFLTPKDQLRDLLKSESSEQLNVLTANLVCKMRRHGCEQGIIFGWQQRFKHWRSIWTLLNCSLFEHS